MNNSGNCYREENSLLLKQEYLSILKSLKNDSTNILSCKGLPINTFNYLTCNCINNYLQAVILILENMRDENVVTNLEIIQKINIFVDLICSRNNKNPLNNKEIKMIDQMIDETIQYIY